MKDFDNETDYEETPDTVKSHSFDNRWESPPSLANIKKIMRDCRESHNIHVAEVDSWLALKDGGKIIPKGEDDLSRFRSKLIRKQAEWRYSQLTESFLSSERLFSTKPATHSDVEVAKTVGILLNKQFRADIDKIEMINRYVMSAVDEGTVIVKTSWEKREGTRTVENPIMEIRPVTDMNQALVMQQQGLPPMEQVQVGVEEVEEDYIIYNRPLIEICDYRHVIVGKDKKFFFHSWDSTIADLERSGLYENLDKIKTSDFGVSKDISEDTLDFRSDMAAKDHENRQQKTLSVTEYWGEWYVGESQGVIQILFSFIGDVIVRMEENPYPDKEPPFTVAKYRDRLRNEYGAPDAEILEDAQSIQGAAMRGVIDLLAKSANAQVGMDQSALSSEQMDNFKNKKDYTYDGNITGGRSPYVIHAYPDIPSGALQIIDMMENEASNLTGNRGFSQSTSRGSMGESATMTRVADDAASQRTQAILRRLEEGLVQIGRKITMMNAEFLTDGEVVRISDEEFVEISRDDLKGSVDIELNISTVEAEQQKANDKTFMLQTMASVLPGPVTMQLLASTFRSRKEYALAEAIEAYQPQPDPAQQEQQALEIELLRAKVQNEYAQAQENAADIALKQARARNLESKSDISDLDFTSRVDGSDVKRNMEFEDHKAKLSLDDKAANLMMDQARGVSDVTSTPDPVT